MALHSSRLATDVGGSSVSDRTDATSMNSRNVKNRKPYSPELQDICRIDGEQQQGQCHGIVPDGREVSATDCWRGLLFKSPKFDFADEIFLP